MMFSEKAVRQRVYDLYRAMKARAKPKVFRTGRRAGKVRKHGLDGLPFTKEQLYAHMYKQVGEGVILCPYCVEIGRNARPIDLINCVLDHKDPVSRGGSWDLSNLNCVCGDCNNVKGSLTFEAFVTVVRAIEGFTDQLDRAYLYKCLRTHGTVMRGWKGKGAVPKLEIPPLLQEFDETF